MKKIKLSDVEIKDIIHKYTHEPIGCAEIGKQYGVSREVIVRILKENNVTLTPAGQKYRGGKKEASKRFYQNNKEKLNTYYQQWLSNTDLKYRKEKTKEWREKNREKLREKGRINQAKRRQDPQIKLYSRFGTAVWQNIKDNGATKYKKTFKILPYTFEELKNHLEKLFQNGMTWNNYGEWHVDHAIPQSHFKYDSVDSEDFQKCWALGNLKPMWGRDNYSKNNNLTHLTLEAVREIRCKGKYIKLKYHDVLLSKEYLQTIIDNYGKEYLEDYIDDVLYVLRTSSPQLPQIETLETLYGIQKHIYKIDPLDEDGNIVNGRVNSYGNMLLKSHFKSYWRSNYKKRKSPQEAWLNDAQMRLILKYRMGINNSNEVFDISLRQMIKGISATRTSISFFKPLLAAYLYQSYLGDVDKPIVFDPCCGFGGRMVGFKLSYPNGTYIGCEPNVDTYKELKELALNFDNVILHNCKFEDLSIDFDYDLALTSIPYFDLEEYSQVMVYNNFDDWCEKFIKPLIDLDNLVVNMSSDLCDKLGLHEFIDCYLINNKNHFKANKNYEAILKINFETI